MCFPSNSHERRMFLSHITHVGHYSFIDEWWVKCGERHMTYRLRFSIMLHSVSYYF